MGDDQLVRSETPARRGRRPWIFVLAAAALVVLVAGVAWYVMAQRSAASDWERQSALDLAVPAGDAFQNDTPWVRMSLAPARPGEDNAIHFITAVPGGTP